MPTTTPDYWTMPDADLRAAWRTVDSAFTNDPDYYNDDHDGERIETLNFIEDAILQRIGAPEHASGDDPRWQDRIREWGTA